MRVIGMYCLLTELSKHENIENAPDLILLLTRKISSYVTDADVAYKQRRNYKFCRI